MFRFIDLRGQGTGYRFAFFDTRTDSFLEFGYDMSWDSLEDLKESCMENHDLFSRLSRLCPEWVNDGKEDNIALFYEGGSEGGDEN